MNFEAKGFIKFRGAFIRGWCSRWFSWDQQLSGERAFPPHVSNKRVVSNIMVALKGKALARSKDQVFYYEDVQTNATNSLDYDRHEPPL